MQLVSVLLPVSASECKLSVIMLKHSQCTSSVKGKGHPATGQGGPRGSGEVKAPDFLDVGHYKGGSHQPYAPAAFAPGEIPGTHFQRLSRPQGTWFHHGEPWKKSPVTPPVIDPGTVRLVVQCLNHYATPGPSLVLYLLEYR